MAEEIIETQDSEGAGEIWHGGFPDELMSDLKELGFDDPANDLGEDGLKGFASLHSEWGAGAFLQNMQSIRETLELLPEETQAKYKKNPALLNSPKFLKDVAKVLRQYQTEKELSAERNKNGLDFGASMAEAERQGELRYLQGRVDSLLFQHQSRMSAEENRWGGK